MISKVVHQIIADYLEGVPWNVPSRYHVLRIATLKCASHAIRDVVDDQPCAHEAEGERPAILSCCC